MIDKKALTQLMAFRNKKPTIQTAEEVADALKDLDKNMKADARNFLALLIVSQSSRCAHCVAIFWDEVEQMLWEMMSVVL